MKKHDRRDSARHHQGFVAVVQVQPVFGNKAEVEDGRALVSRARDVKESLATRGHFRLDFINASGDQHATVQVAEPSLPLIAGLAGLAIRCAAQWMSATVVAFGNSVTGHHLSRDLGGCEQEFQFIRGRQQRAMPHRPHRPIGAQEPDHTK